MANRILLHIPSFTVAPDGTILWPRRSECGCSVISAIEPIVQTKEYEILVEACDEHFRKVKLEHGANAKYYEDEFLLIAKSSDLY